MKAIRSTQVNSTLEHLFKHILIKNKFLRRYFSAKLRTVFTMVVKSVNNTVIHPKHIIVVNVSSKLKLFIFKTFNFFSENTVFSSKNQADVKQRSILKSRNKDSKIKLMLSHIL